MGLGTQDGGKEDHRWALSVVGYTLVARKLTKKEGLVRRGKNGQRRQDRTHRAYFKAYKLQIINNRKDNGKKGNISATRTKQNSASTHAKIHIYNT